MAIVTYNSIMIKAKEQIKSMLALRDITLKSLANMISEKTGKNCSYGALSKKINRGTIDYNEVMFIAEILNFKIHFEDMEQV